MLINKLRPSENKLSDGLLISQQLFCQLLIDLLIKRGEIGFADILVDQGTADSFLAEQLQPERLEAACAAAGQPLTLRRQKGYDHGYYFIASFMRDHIAHHAAILNH